MASYVLEFIIFELVRGLLEADDDLGDDLGDDQDDDDDDDDDDDK